MFNFSFCRFLNKQTKTNTAINEVDRALARKRNLVPANTGIFGIVLWITSTIFFYFIPYGGFLLPRRMDVGIRAFISMLYTDSWYGLGLAVTLTYGNSTAKMKIRKIFSCLWNRSSPNITSSATGPHTQFPGTSSTQPKDLTNIGTESVNT